MASDAMKRNLLYILLALFPLLGCQREYAIYDELSVTNHTLNIGKTPGQTHIMVYPPAPGRSPWNGTWSGRR